MDYPHMIKVSRAAGTGEDPTPGEQDPDTGLWTDDDVSDSTTTVWEGPCDVQDVGEVIKRDQAGQPTLESDATCFLQRERAVDVIHDGDSCVITWEDRTQSSATVIWRRRLDGVLFLRRVSG